MIILLSILSGILYRIGGSKYYNTKARDFGSNLITNFVIGVVLYFNKIDINFTFGTAFILSFGLLLASLTTYWKKKGTPGTFFTWFLTGFFYGLSAFPFYFISKLWIGILLRSLVLGLFVMLWWRFRPNSIRLFSHEWDGAQIEEFGRGFILTLTTPLLLC